MIARSVRTQFGAQELAIGRQTVFYMQLFGKSASGPDAVFAGIPFGSTPDTARLHLRTHSDVAPVTDDVFFHSRTCRLVFLVRNVCSMVS